MVKAKIESLLGFKLSAAKGLLVMFAGQQVGEIPGAVARVTLVRALVMIDRDLLSEKGQELAKKGLG